MYVVLTYSSLTESALCCFFVFFFFVSGWFGSVTGLLFPYIYLINNWSVHLTGLDQVVRTSWSYKWASVRVVGVDSPGLDRSFTKHDVDQPAQNVDAGSDVEDALPFPQGVLEERD